MSKNTINLLAAQPLLMARNRVWRTYLGGMKLDEFQGIQSPTDSQFPEEWVASTVKATNIGREKYASEGLSRVETPGNVPDDQHLLYDLIVSDPSSFLGPSHVKRFGTNMAVLVKLLDAGERLTIQVHPDASFAHSNFDSPFGKTEAWYVLGARTVDGEQPCVYMGFKEGVTRETWESHFESQDIAGMLNSLNRVPIQTGEIYLVKGGMPHAIGKGAFLVEIQEPTDLTLRTEKTTPAGNPVPEWACHQGIGFDQMLNCFHYDTYTVGELRKQFAFAPKILRETPDLKYVSLIDEDITDLFGMEELSLAQGDYCWDNDGRFAVALVLSGEGTVYWQDPSSPTSIEENLALKASNNLFIPASVSRLRWSCRETSTPFRVLMCYPPKS